jgi:hypothetical protein
MTAAMLLRKLDNEAEQKHFEQRRLEARQRRIKPPPTQMEQKNANLLQLRRKAAAAEHELKLNRQLEAESKRLQRANIALYKENMTAKDRMELDADTDRMADWASRYCKEAGSDWREQATVAFDNKKL